MGNYNFKPQASFAKNQTVEIIGSKLSKEHVPEELKKLGRGAYVVQSTKLYSSRPSAQPVYITRVKFPKTNKYETFLTTDLRPV